MGPRPFSRGDCVGCWNRVARARFNGAATFQSRTSHVQGEMDAALQWGRDLSVAETAVLSDDEYQLGAATFQSRRQGSPKGHGWDMLQWGRDLSVAETRRGSLTKSLW